MDELGSADQQRMAYPARSGYIENLAKKELRVGKSLSFVILKAVGSDAIKSREEEDHANTWCKRKTTLLFFFFLLWVKWLCTLSPCVQAAYKHCPLDLGLSCQILPCDSIENMGVVYGVI